MSCTSFVSHRIWLCRAAKKLKSDNSFAGCRLLSSSAVDGNILKVERNESSGVLTLTLNRPKQRNALSRALLEALREQLSLAAENPKDVRAVILQGEGPVFSAGHDLRELVADPENPAIVFELCSEVMQLLPNVPQPTVAAVEGLATAAGCQLAAACDMVIGSPDSGYCTPGARSIGLFCHTPAVPIVRSVGIKRALDMLYTGRVVSSQEALSYGLVTRLAENPREEAAKIASQVASFSACAVQPGKRTLYQQAGAATIEDAYEIASQAMLINLETKDAIYGIKSFISKKKPEWEHR